MIFALSENAAAVVGMTLGAVYVLAGVAVGMWVTRRSR